MMRWGLVLLACLFANVAQAQGLEVKLDVEAARAVLAAVRDPALTRERALEIAKLPGNQGLIRKAHSYNRPADNALLAEALLAAAQRRTSEADAYFQFANVRDAADKIAPVLETLADPASGALDEVKARIARFTPARVTGTVTGYVVVGGTSGGFAFGEPEFFLNLARYPSVGLAKTILAHELYHGVQGLAAKLRRPQSDASKACLAKMPAAENIGRLYDSLIEEAGASYVGDVLALPADDAGSKSDRDRAQRGVNMVSRSVTLLGLSTHSLASNGPVSWDDIYALGFYGDEILYSLGYVMMRAIAKEAGDEAVAELIDKPGAALITRYAGLTSYGKDKATPALDPATLDWAKRIAACY